MQTVTDTPKLTINHAIIENRAVNLLAYYIAIEGFTVIKFYEVLHIMRKNYGHQ